MDFKVGDRVVVIKKDYDIGAYDIGAKGVIYEVGDTTYSIFLDKEYVKTFNDVWVKHSWVCLDIICETELWRVLE